MKGRILSLIALLAFLVAIGGVVTPASAISLRILDDNKMFFRSVENVYDSNGNMRVPEEVTYTNPFTGEEETYHMFPQVQVNDTFVGILNLQEVEASGNTIWEKQSGVDQTTGFFATKVYAVYPPGGDPWDPTNLDNHIVLGPPTRTTFFGPDSTTSDDDIDITGMLQANEMLAIYEDNEDKAPGFISNYTTGETLSDDFDNATDGTLWATFGFLPGPNGTYETPTPPPAGTLINDDGYWYTHAPSGAFIENFTAETLAQVDIYRDYTGVPGWNPLNDPYEVELGDIPWFIPIPFLYNDMYFNAEITGNEDWLAGDSGWVFENNDPAHVNPVPEPCTMLLLGSGLVGFGAFARRRRLTNKLS